MKAKLKKENSQYNLYLDNDMIASTYPYQNQKMLSKQNCDDIFGVVDVEKLAKMHHKLQYIEAYNPDIEPYVVADYTAGFNKAMELNKDKQFTLEDIKKAMNYMFEQTVVFGNKVSALDVDRFIQSLQQPTEIEVVIEMEDTFEKTSEIYVDEVGSGNFFSHSKKPKLDSEGCLVLKRV
jgi:hypothetical protein